MSLVIQKKNMADAPTLSNMSFFIPVTASVCLLDKPYMSYI